MRKLKNIQIKISNLEFRTCTEHLLVTDEEDFTTAEIVCWGEEKDYSWTIAYWIAEKDDMYSLKFVGSRPFSTDVDFKTFWMLVKWGQELLSSDYALNTMVDK